MSALLSPQQSALVEEVHGLVDSVVRRLASWEERAEDQRRLRDALQGLRELFLLVVAGEFNAGKSALINALLGGSYLEQGVTPTTSQVQLLEYGEHDDTVMHDGGVWRRRLPADVLHEMRIVDTPGTNAILREHEALTRDFVPRADLVLFVTSADRPFTESEREFLEAISSWGKKIVFIINKIDLVAEERQVREIIDYVSTNARSIVDDEPRVFALSAKHVLATLSNTDTMSDRDTELDERWRSFEDWMRDALTQIERLRLKLTAPLGIVERVLFDALATIDAHRDVLRDDQAALNAIQASLGEFERDTTVRFEERLSTIDARIATLRERGEAFLDERLRLGRVRGLLDGDRLRADFEREVIDQTPELVTADVSSMIDWLIDLENVQWRTIHQHLDQRSNAEHVLQAADDGDVGFADRRSMLLGMVGYRAADALAGFDAQAEARRLEIGVQDALTKTALAEAGAVGIGFLIPLLIGSTAADITGVVAGGILAVVGFTLLPHRRRKAAQMLRDKVAELRSELRAGLSEAVQQELQRMRSEMESAIAPYARFVLTEQESLTSLAFDLRSSLSEADLLREKIASVNNALG